MELQARQGSARPGTPRRGQVRLRRHGKVSQGVAWLVPETQARHGVAGSGEARSGAEAQAWRVLARRDEARLGAETQARPGRASLGAARLGNAGTARHGSAGPGGDSQAWQGVARFGLACPGKVSQARQGQAWQGQARRGNAGKARWARRGRVRPGNAGFFINCFLSMSNYEFRNGAHIKGVTADQAGDELARIYVEKGELTAPLVVDESRPEEAPLHPAFEWDDAVAAERHREHQARNIIRSVKVITEDKPSEPVYVHVSSAQSYKPVAEVVKCVSMYAEALLAATKQVEQAQHALDVLERHCSDENEPIIRDLRLVINNTCDVLKTLATA